MALINNRLLLLIDNILAYICHENEGRKIDTRINPVNRRPG